jgi:hypothetical protein
VPLGEADWLAGPAGPQLPRAATPPQISARCADAHSEKGPAAAAAREREVVGFGALAGVKNFDLVAKRGCL